jgi:hypothetical protein
MGYEAKILADSISPSGVRLITVQATFPRFILAEVNTHRVFSRNSASSRAIPPEKLIKRVEEDPFVPETFNLRVKGMGVGDVVDDAKHVISKAVWLDALNEAVTAAHRLNDLGIDKSRVNRLLEPFLWHTAIISSTEWDNFFALRCPPGEEATIDFPAQLEFQTIAILMRRAMRASEPRPIALGEWHLPLVLDGEEGYEHPDLERLYWPRVSAGRCARVSFDTQDNYEAPNASYQRQVSRLEKNGHLSPSEHPACPTNDTNFVGNFRGWWQLRKEIPHEENLVGYLEDREHWDQVPDPV